MDSLIAQETLCYSSAQVAGETWQDSLEENLVAPLLPSVIVTSLFGLVTSSRQPTPICDQVIERGVAGGVATPC
ncbi:hypothetical protein RRG08_021142 [Elysia crispata]|uniref:Uncharacterized protein n=1 Tax=Elysia crispata TaxID=231223 RepID=A0AAE1DAB1_9GAST|nr:hypothetical protein RRG08_021142 [Elysia crispata]